MCYVSKSGFAGVTFAFGLIVGSEWRLRFGLGLWLIFWLRLRLRLRFGLWLGRGRMLKINLESWLALGFELSFWWVSAQVDHIQNHFGGTEPTPTLSHNKNVWIVLKWLEDLNTSDPGAEQSLRHGTPPRKCSGYSASFELSQNKWFGSWCPVSGVNHACVTWTPWIFGYVHDVCV